MTAQLPIPRRFLPLLALFCASFAIDVARGENQSTGSSEVPSATVAAEISHPLATTVTLSELTWTYDGTPKAPLVTTEPEGLIVALTFNGDTTVPTNAGTYEVVATIVDPEYVGSSSATFTITKATPSLTWTQPDPITYGTPLSEVQLNAAADVAGSFTYAPSLGTVLNAGPQQLLSVVFTPRDEMNYAVVSTLTTIAVKKAIALVSVSDLTQPYDSTPANVAVRTVPANLKVDLAYDAKPEAPVFPGRYSVAATVDDPNYVGSAFENLSLTVTALVRHAPQLRGGIDGSLQVLSGEDVVLQGNGWIAGDLLVPGTPSLELEGLPMAAGIYDAGGDPDPTDYAVELGGNSVLRYIVRQIDPLSMPVVAMPQAPAGTRDVVLDASNADLGDLTTLRNLTLAKNAGAHVLPGGIYGALTANGGSALVLGRAGATAPEVYHLRGLSLRDGAGLRISGPVLIVLANGATINGTAGAPDHPEWLTLAVAAGGVTMRADATLFGYIVAPAGEVVIDRRAVVTGEVISDRLTINPNGILAEPRRVAE
jgi:hypothetical protein